MSTSRPFAYNPGSLISGTNQYGNLAVGVSDEPYADNYGGVIWWNGPDEDLGYVIAQSVPDNSQPTPILGTFASVGFFRSEVLSEPSFIEIANSVAGQNFATGNQASAWLTNNGYWTSYPGLTNNIILEGFYFPGSVGAGYLATADYAVDADVSINFTNVLSTTGTPLTISGSVDILSGMTTGYTQIFVDYNYSALTDESTFTGITFSVTGTTSYEFSGEVSASTFNVTPTPTPSVTPSVTPTSSIPGVTPSVTPSVTGTNTGVTPTPTGTSASGTPTPTGTPTGTPLSGTTTPTPTGTPADVTPTPTGTPADVTPTPTGTPADVTPTPTGTPLSGTTTPTPADVTPTPTGTPLSGTTTPTPADVTPTPTGTPADVTPTPTGTPNNLTPTPTVTTTTGLTPTPTETSTTPTPTGTPDVTPTQTPTGATQYHVWNLYRTEGAEFPACSTVNASQVIGYDLNYAIGLVFKGSDGLCYTIANDGFQSTPPTITVIDEFGNCNECTEG